MRVRWHARAAGFVAAGLTSRGAPRIYRPRISERERAWRAFRASLTIIRPDYLLTVGRGENPCAVKDKRMAADTINGFRRN
jgi:hypothetical protein